MPRPTSAFLLAACLSLLLHGVVLDLARSPDSGPPSLALPSLRVRLEPAAPAPAEEARRLGAATKAPGVGASPARIPARQPSGGLVPARDEEEGLIAYRLGLAQALPPPTLALSHPLRLRLAVGGDGRALGVVILESSSTPSHDARLAQWLRAAAARTVPPVVLQGKSFAVEVELE